MKLFQFLFFSIGVLLLLVIAKTYLESRDYINWVEITGELKYLAFQKARYDTEGGETIWGSDYARVIYLYKVNGVEYIGTRILPLQSVFLPANLMNDLKNGPVKMFYNPKVPGESFLYLHTPTIQLLLLGFAAMTCVILSLFLPVIIDNLLKSIMKHI